MKGIHIRFLLLGFGLGLICASLVFLLYIFRMDTLGALDADDDDPAPASDARDNASAPAAGTSQGVKIISLDDSEPASQPSRMSASTPTAAAATTTVVSTAPSSPATAQTATTAAAVPTEISTAVVLPTGTATPTSPATSATSTTTTAAATVPSATTASTAASSRAPTTAAATSRPTASATAAAAAADTVSFSIYSRDTATSVAERLHDLDLISDTQAFLDRLENQRLTGRLLDGTYRLEKGLALDVLIDRITVHQ